MLVFLAVVTFLATFACAGAVVAVVDLEGYDFFGAGFFLALKEQKKIK